MDFILLTIFIISIIGIRFRKNDIDGYISPAQTSAVNGIFVMIVFMRHINQYITIEKYDHFFYIFDTRIGQLLVTTFLFYSGYGIMYSLINKNNYVHTMPKRILKILLQFDVAVILYLIVSFIVGNHYSLSEILLAFVALFSIGNSTWYIFAILCLYTFTFLAGIIFKKNNILIFLTVTFCTLLYIFVIHHFGKGSHWYNTILCYPAGMLFSIFSEKINVFLHQKKYNRILGLAIGMILFLLFYVSYNVIKKPFIVRLGLYELTSVFFVLAIVSFTTIFVVSNPILVWLGKYLFEIYILQRIPMNLLEGYLPNKYIYFVLCFLITLILSVGYKYVEKYLGKAIDFLIK